MSEALVALRQAAFGYDRKPVLRGVNLEVHAGEWVSVAGPNGSGKSTLLRGALGLLPALEGEVQRSDGAIGYVPQRSQLDSLYPLSVLEVVLQGATQRLPKLGRVPAAEREFALQCLGRVGLEDRSQRPFSAMSGGQRQRVLFARALASKPGLLVLDEPAAGLDEASAAEVRDLMHGLRREGKMGLLVVSHDAADRSAATRIVEVRGGTATEVEALGA